jgi:hypothetical protein
MSWWPISSASRLALWSMKSSRVWGMRRGRALSRGRSLFFRRRIAPTFCKQLRLLGIDPNEERSRWPGYTLFHRGIAE